MVDEAYNEKKSMIQTDPTCALKVKIEAKRVRQEEYLL
jgi:hypothetical protein